MVETDIDYRHEAYTLFVLFSSNKRLSITVDTVMDFAEKFDALYQTDFFTSFKPPIEEEYFCQQLNFLLLIDFIMSFFKVNNPSFDVKTINTQFIFEFFVNLGEFFSFTNYLDVDHTVTDYLKFMITLYALQLDRDVIERHFHNDIEILDNFFAYEVMPKLFNKIHYKDIDALPLKCDGMLKVYKTAISAYKPHIDYSTAEYSDTDAMFVLHFRWDHRPEITTKKKTVMIPNPDPMDSDSDDSFYDYSGGDYNGDYPGDDGYTGNYGWRRTPEIISYVNVIEPTDPAYSGHFEKFVCKQYHALRLQYDALLKEVRNLCADIRIKDYAQFLPDDFSEYAAMLKTIIGVPLDLNKFNKKYIGKCYEVACQYGHLNVVQQLVPLYNDQLTLSKTQIGQAASSPNRQIFAYLKSKADQCPQLKKSLEIFYENKNVLCEPKIKFK